MTTTRGFDELVALAVETGREGVKALKAQPVEKPAPAPAAPKAAAPAKPMGPNDYMVIGLARIDDRLIHGRGGDALDQRDQRTTHHRGQ